MAVKKEYAQVHPLTRDEWRAWLDTNHDSQSGVWLISYKASTGKGRITWDGVVEKLVGSARATVP